MKLVDLATIDDKTVVAMAEVIDEARKVQLVVVVVAAAGAPSVR